jgi:hypothetical protein
MKIFFNASLSGKKVFEGSYKRISEILDKSEHFLIDSPVLIGSTGKVASESIKQAGDYYRKLQKWIKSADICVFEVSFPSLGVGYEVSLALQLNKPVIALHTSGHKPHILEGIADDRMQLLEYELEYLDDVLVDALEYASEQQDTRFNFFISPKHQAYLDWVAQHRKIPRAVFLRRLINDRIKKDPEFS